MKRFTFNLDARFVEDVFKPIRSKAQAITVLMKCTKLMLIGNIVPPERKAGELLLVVSKVSRIFLFSNDKYFSLTFPFIVKNDEGGLMFSTRNIADISNKITSDVIGVVASSDKFDSLDSLDFAESLLDFEETEPSFWPFLLSLLMYEDGYVRYDYDPKHVNGDIHPLHHYDFFYSSLAACKVGLRGALANDDMVGFMLPETACHYIEKRT